MRQWPLRQCCSSSQLCWAVCVALAGCVVSDFDEVRERSAATRADAGERCGPDAAESAEACGSDREPDAQISETEPVDMDAGPVLAAESGAQPTSDASANMSSDASASATIVDAMSGKSDANMCVDIVRDPLNCGACGIDCSASAAQVTCENMRCVRACEDGYDDCNKDLALGLAGNGCERKIDSDANNCGQCRRRCTPPINGYATCDKQLCNGQTLELSDEQAGSEYGNPAGGMAYNQACPIGQVLVGIDGTGTDIVYGVGARCAPLKMALVNGAITVSTSTVSAIPPVGGIIDPAPPTYRRECPPGTFVIGISGTLWIWPTAVAPSVRTLALRCGTARVGLDRKVSVEAGTTLTIGEEELPAMASFSRQCAAPGAVSGINGRAGAYLDSIAVSCGKLSVLSLPTGSSTAAAD